MAHLQCVRCTQQRGDVDRSHMFLCDECAATFKAAFGDAAPSFEFGVGDGHCEFCGHLRQLRYRQWLLCAICVNVVGSYRKGKVSALFVLTKLNELVAQTVPGLTFREVDPVLVRRHANQFRRRVPATQLDLEGVRDERRLFWVEVKTGPGAIDAMPAFQLDCQDCDDISNTMQTSGLPALIVHCRIAKTVTPPTTGITGVEAWWADPWEFAAAFQSVGVRRDVSRKHAALFDTSCFHALPLLADKLSGDWIERSTTQVGNGDLPRFYPALPSKPKKAKARVKKAKAPAQKTKTAKKAKPTRRPSAKTV